MHPDLDSRLINSIPSLLRLQNFFLVASERHLSSQRRMGRSLPLPNFAEIALISCRPKPRLAAWLISANTCPTPSTSLSVSDLLTLRNQLKVSLTESRVVPKTKMPTLVTYLSLSPCPTVSNLAEFAGIHPSRAKVWLRRATDLSILKCHRKSNELIFLNLDLVSMLADASQELVAEQFDFAVSRPDWLKHSVYRSVLS
jgi:hypothetical protein